MSHEQDIAQVAYYDGLESKQEGIDRLYEIFDTLIKPAEMAVNMLMLCAAGCRDNDTIKKVADELQEAINKAKEEI